MTGSAPAAERTAYRTCPLCEAGCGLAVTVSGDQVVRIRGDRDDVFSRGYLCPKGPALKQLHEDPDRVRTPLVKQGGTFRPVSWDEAFEEVDARWRAVVDRHGRDATAVYLGNPNAHNLAGLLYAAPLVKSLGTRNVFSASTLDQRPKEVASSLLYGRGRAAVPDVDRTRHLVLLGSNPLVSNGSYATAPDWPGRIRRLLARGGRLVVVDPRRTKTAEVASEYHPIRPGTDALLLMAMVHTLFDDGLVRLGRADGLVERVDVVERLAAPFPPEAVSELVGMAPATVRRLARDLANSPAGVVHGRMGTTVQRFGTLASWLVDVVNILTGNLDRPGGAMFPTPAADAPNPSSRSRVGSLPTYGRWRSRVRGLPESLGELPSICLAEEIDTPGAGRVRALVTVAGNPVLSVPNAGRLDRALGSLELMVSVDMYVNETTRHADVLLPAASPLVRSHYDVMLLRAAVRNVANYSQPVLPQASGEPDEWQVLARLAMLFRGDGAHGDPAVVDEEVVTRLVEAAVRDPGSPVHGRPAADVMAALRPRSGPERLLDLMLRFGPYGDGFGARPGGLTLDRLIAEPHGVDLGPLVPRLPEVLRTPAGTIDLAPELVVADVPRLRAHLDAPRDGSLLLVGRRELRSNNSWMHNLEVLVRGRPRCTLQMHPDDARRSGLRDGALARVTSPSGSLVLRAEVTDTVMPGVVSIPHGWGHDLPGAAMAVASRQQGANVNVLTDDVECDAPTGTALLNGVPVTVVAVDDADGPL